MLETHIQWTITATYIFVHILVYIVTLTRESVCDSNLPPFPLEQIFWQFLKEALINDVWKNSKKNCHCTTKIWPLRGVNSKGGLYIVKFLKRFLYFFNLIQGVGLVSQSLNGGESTILYLNKKNYNDHQLIHPSHKPFLTTPLYISVHRTYLCPLTIHMNAESSTEFP